MGPVPGVPGPQLKPELAGQEAEEQRAEARLGQLPQAPAILACLLRGSGEEAGCFLLGPGRSRPRGPAAGLAASLRTCPALSTSLSQLPDRHHHVR